MAEAYWLHAVSPRFPALLWLAATAGAGRPSRSIMHTRASVPIFHSDKPSHHSTTAMNPVTLTLGNLPPRLAVSCN
jgi:hypothetical protein